ncbi:MAG: hypothetical protein IPM25_00905 [Chloracidobacterium sp.]|nr:hypothetical protein [Chloracidobacterium sp.]
MFNILTLKMVCLRCVSAFTLVCFVAATSAYSLTNAPGVYDVELVVSTGKKSVETDADIFFEEKGFRVVPDKNNFKDQGKEILYSEITQADHSFSKKPMLSGGGAVATALLVGVIFAVPFLFIKKKKHWLTVQAGEKFAVIKLGDRNFRQIVAELRAKGVTVNDLKDESKPGGGK